MNRSSARGGRYLGVELVGIHLQRGGHRVLRGLAWCIRPGERWVLLGANGAGKTQLLKLLAGDVWPQPRAKSRRIYRLGREAHADPHWVREEIAYVGPERQDRYQHYAWNHRVLTVVGTGVHRTDIPLAPLRRAEAARCLRILRQLGIASLASRRFLTLSHGERRLVLLARALAWRPRLLLLDEPLSGLDPQFRARVRAALGTLRRRQLPWVFATHRREEVPPGANRLAVLSAGRLALQPWRRAATVARATVPARAATVGNGTALIRLENAWVWREGTAVLAGVSLQLSRGDCWVVHGANGSGKSTLLGALRGDHGIASGGAIWRRGLAAGAPLELFQRRVGCVAPELQAALPRHLGALEAVVAGLRNSHGLDRSVTRSEQQRARVALRRVGALRFASRPLRELSYGQVRRVLFARALVHGPDILLLDEPYTGLDAPTRKQLRALVERAAAAGMTIVMASHHRDEWPVRVTHELLLDAGRARYCGPVRALARVPARRSARRPAPGPARR
jgi:molybdate transport system ATP-binding protein